MKKLSQKDKMMLLIMAAVLVLGGLFWFYVKPARTELAAQTARAAEASDNVTKLEQQLASLVKAAKPDPAKKTNIADQLRLAKAYPGEPDVPATILELDRLARVTKVSLLEGKADDGTDFAGTTGTAFSIKVEGTYFELQQFIAQLHDQVRLGLDGRLEINGRLFAITKAEIAPKDTATVTASSPLVGTISAVAFSKTPAAAAGAGATTPTSTTTGGATTTTTSTGGATQ